MTAGLGEPLPRALSRVLRDLVVAQARGSGADDRRRGLATLHVGIPGRSERTFTITESPLDHALRTEIIEAMAQPAVRRGLVPLLWLTREPDGPDMDDLAWAASAAAAGGEMGIRLDLVVVTRRSWRDPRSGAGRTWRRLRTTAPDDPGDS